MPSHRHVFTSESVTEGHPDKIADQISDAVLDAIYEKDPRGRVACESLLTTYSILDLVPKGRDEEGLAFSMAWLRHHDRYDAKYQVDPRVGYEVKRDAVKA